jgi:hypothetical protein
MALTTGRVRRALMSTHDLVRARFTDTAPIAHQSARILYARVPILVTDTVLLFSLAAIRLRPYHPVATEDLNDYMAEAQLH